MEEVEKIKQNKQNYLRSEILEKGFSPQHFSEYLSKKKENGTDINNWTFNELEYIIKEYKSEPVIFFKHKPEFYQQQIQVKIISQEDIEIKISDSKIIQRTIQEFQTVCDILQKQYQGLFLFKKVENMIGQYEDKSKLQNNEIDLLVKYLYSYKTYLNNKLLNSFFEDEQSTFQLFVQKYQPVIDKRQYILNNFSRKFIEGLQNKNKLKQYQIESVHDCPENSTNCVGYMKKYNQKMNMIWDRFSTLSYEAQERLIDLSKIFQKMSNTMNELSNQTTIIDQKLNLNFKNQIYQFQESQQNFSKQSKHFKNISYSINKYLKNKIVCISDFHKQFSEVFQQEINILRKYKY